VGARRSWATLLLCAAAAGPAYADTPAADAKQGLDLYTSGDFAGAVPFLERAHDADPTNIDLHFALAQALRQSGKCDEAMPHYKALLDAAPDKADAVRAAMAQCPAPAAITPPPPAPPPPAPPQTVIVHDTAISTGDMLMLGGAGAGLAAAACLFLAAHDDANDAQAAALYSDYDSISARSRNEYIASGVFAVAGVALAVTAVVRISRSKESSTGVSLAPHPHGGAIVLGGSW
jgi:tetratricopeptide (TPR) repeat protein